MNCLRLLRLSNAPTAVADILMGLAVATGSFEPAVRTLLLIAASLAIYHGGMVLNDVVDSEKDKEERPDRPIPSGAISRQFAIWLAGLLLLSGASLGAYVGVSNESTITAVSACLLPLTVVAYNSRLKSTLLGPWLMGSCRALNGMLGLGLASNLNYLLAISPGVLLYIAGVTLLARNEANASEKKQLTQATICSTAGIVWLVIYPMICQLSECHLATSQPIIWIALLTIILLMIFRHHTKAILSPTPIRVQKAVVNAIQGLVIINAGLALGYADNFSALTILAMLPIAKLMSLWIPAT